MLTLQDRFEGFLHREVATKHRQAVVPPSAKRPRPIEILTRGS